jgi:predicted deacylase
MRVFTLGEADVQPGQRATVNLPVSVLSNHTHVALPVHVVHGEEHGPVIFLSGAIHGDEIQGVEIIRRILNHPALTRLKGTLLAVPIVNSFGFLNHTRYMPDRRDLNRCFPGSDRGSLASQVADIFFREVVLKCRFGIDFHTAALHRTNLPQIRLAPDEPELLAMAEAFAPPVILLSKLREKSLRLTAGEAGVKVLLYEGGEALRFDELSIDAAVKAALEHGVLRCQRLGEGARKRHPAHHAPHRRPGGKAGGRGRGGRSAGHLLAAARRGGGRHHRGPHQPAHRQPRRRRVSHREGEATRHHQGTRRRGGGAGG